LLPVGLARHPIRAHLERLEERAEPVIFGLRDRIVLMRVAAGAFHGEAEEGRGRVLCRVLYPYIAAEQVPVARQITGGAQDLRVGWSDLVSRDHLADHFVISLILVQGFDDPVPPSPDVPLAVPHL